MAGANLLEKLKNEVKRETNRKNAVSEVSRVRKSQNAVAEVTRSPLNKKNAEVKA